MSDPVLTDEEKGALLEGMSSGEVEVQAGGRQTYASVKPFVIAPRSVISTNSYPRLQTLNRQFAARMGKQTETLLNAEATVNFEGVRSVSYSDACDACNGLSLIVEFTPKPLDGPALIQLDASTVQHLVETFFGGQGNDSAHSDPDFFTPGEVNTAMLFSNSLLGVLADVWAPLAGINPEIVGSHLSTGVIERVEPTDAVIECEFSLATAGKEQAFRLLWPMTTVLSLLPVFEGQKRGRDAAEDARWRKALRTSLVNTIVNISSDVGHTRMSLRDVARLAPGDIIRITNPQNSTVMAHSIPILAGRFGVHDGRYAIEATGWIDAETRHRANLK